MEVLVIASNQAKEPYPVMPIGAVMLADLLEKRGDNVRLLDLCFSNDPIAEIQTALQSPTDMALVSFRNLNNHDILHITSYLPKLVAIAETIRAKNIPLYIGGAATAIAPEEILARTGADGVFVGSAKSFVNHLGAGTLQRGVMKDWNGETYVPSNIERWIDVNAYFKYERMIPLRLKRGCPFKCSYCNYNALEGARDFIEPGDDLEKFIRQWQGRDICFDIVDSMFNVPEQWVIDVCRWLAERDLKGPFHISAFTPIVKKAATLEAMMSAGATHGMIGADSGCDAMLEAYNKPFRMADIDRFLELRRDYDFRFFWTFIIGAPGETLKTTEETMRFIDRLPDTDPVYITTGVRIYPETDLYKRLTEEGRINESTSTADPLYYFSPELDAARTTDVLLKWAENNQNVLISTETYTDAYQKALEKAAAFGMQSPPTWRNLPVIKRIMKRYLAGQGGANHGRRYGQVSTGAK
ncbi:MAG: cobalamin-dependent protein [Nitrospinae bacterium]|nr:cobalamin-dependent protein [Nitrospinota bacterium]